MIDRIFEEIRAERQRQYWRLSDNPRFDILYAMVNEDLPSETEPKKKRLKLVEIAVAAVNIIECLDRRMGK